MKIDEPGSFYAQHSPSEISTLSLPSGNEITQSFPVGKSFLETRSFFREGNVATASNPCSVNFAAKTIKKSSDINITILIGYAKGTIDLTTCHATAARTESGKALQLVVGKLHSTHGRRAKRDREHVGRARCAQ